MVEQDRTRQYAVRSFMKRTMHVVMLVAIPLKYSADTLSFAPHIPACDRVAFLGARIITGHSVTFISA